MNAKLIYRDDSLEILNFTHNREDEQSGNPYNCSFNIRVKSGCFAGFADGCEYDYKEWKKFVNQLNALYLSKTRKAELVEIGYGSKITFSGDGLGHITINGTVWGDAMTHSMTFEFLTDQTVYKSFIEELQQL